MNQNVNQTELDKFNQLSSRWWDQRGEFRPLHLMNPLRLNYINSRVSLSNKEVLDVGCGGGLLSEAMAKSGASVTGIDLADEALQVAKLHLHESRLKVDYRQISVESMAEQKPGHFDVITCLEMLEHVPQPASVVNACTRLLKPGGSVFTQLSIALQNHTLWLF